MIYKEDKEITAIYYGQRAIAFVYKGARLVWQKVKDIFSCFGAGYWINDAPWDNNGGWAN